LGVNLKDQGPLPTIKKYTNKSRINMERVNSENGLKTWPEELFKTIAPIRMGI
jgi:hypothetical protein